VRCGKIPISLRVAKNDNGSEIALTDKGDGWSKFGCMDQALAIIIISEKCKSSPKYFTKRIEKNPWISSESDTGKQI